MNSFLDGEMLVAGVAAERLSNSKAPIDYEVGQLVKNPHCAQNPRLWAKKRRKLVGMPNCVS